MGIFNKVRDAVTKGRKAFAEQVDNYKNQEFKQAVMGICALIAAADGNVSSEEQQTVLDAIEMLPEFASFDKVELVQIFNSHCDKIQRNSTFGKIGVLADVKKLRQNRPEQADMAVTIGVAVANADGDFDKDEQSAVRDICKELGLRAENYL